MSVRDRFRNAKDRWLPAILALLDLVTRSNTPPASTLPTMCAYHLDTGGKRLRALLPILLAEDLGEDPSRILPFGAACEMLHNATLVHDDLQDGDRLRRGRPTVWARFGEAQAINLGDAMFYFAVLLVQRLEGPAARREALAARLLRETLRVIDGQEREFGLKHVTRPRVDDYFAMVEGKTSGLFSLPLAGAAEFYGSSQTAIDGLAKAARDLGVLFQLQDDLLDLYGDKGREERGSDIGEGKRSVFVVHALEHATAARGSRLIEILDTPREATTAAHVKEALQIFEDTGSRQFVVGELARRREAAQTAIAFEPKLRDLVWGVADLMLEPVADLLEKES
jgi:geranylgeranyl diphosphate synthase, type I